MAASQTLAEWEKRLTPFFTKNLRIIGEIPLSEIELDEILDLVKERIRREGLRHTTDVLTHSYPHTFVTMLAHYAMFNDSQGYWVRLAERLGTPYINGAGRWHQWALALIQGYGLFHFTKENMDNFYVATVRFHGGIPTYSLPDFFERMVHPAVNRYSETPSADLLPLLVKKVLFVDQPVLDFLANSGEMGVTWFEECRQLMRHAQENYGEILPKEDVPNLPHYIYEFFENYSEGSEENLTHWRRPYFQVTPYSEDTAINLVLPRQSFPLGLFTQNLAWQVNWPGKEALTRIPCTKKRLGQEEFTKEEFIPIQAHPKNVSISLCTVGPNQEVIAETRRWSLPLMPAVDQPAVLAFRENRQMLSTIQTLPEAVVYLLFHKDLQLNFEGKAYRIETLPDLMGVWSDWHLERWNLADTVSLEIRSEAGQVWDPIPIARELPQPTLSGGHIFDYSEDKETPLYKHSLPEWRIPIQAGMSKYHALAGWSLSIRNIGNARPELDGDLPFEKFADQVTMDGDWAILPLKAVLGDDVAGTFLTKVEGPRRISASKRFRFWPKVLIKGLELDFPEPNQAEQELEFEVYLPEGAWLENQSGAQAVEILPVDTDYIIKAPPDVYRVQVDLVTKNKSDREVHVPLSVPLPRLRWAIAEEASPGQLEFGQEVINLSVARFDQYSSSALHFQMKGLDKMRPTLSCELVAVDDHKQVLMEKPLFSTDFREDWLRVSLLPFIGMIKHENSMMQLNLAYRRGTKQYPAYPLVTISPQIRIEDAHLENAGEDEWRLTWQEEKPLHNRRVLITSDWQPWWPAREYKIPDDARGEYRIEGLTLAPSQYSLYFYVLNEWSPALKSAPEWSEPHFVHLMLPEDRLAILAEDQGDHDRDFQAAIERACIYDGLGQAEARDTSVSEAAPHLIHLQDLSVLTSTVQWIRQVGVEDSYQKYFVRRLFDIRIVNRMLENYKPGDPILTTYLKMVDEVDYIPLDSAIRFLETVDDLSVIITSLKVINSRGHPARFETLIALIDCGRLSIEGGSKLLHSIVDDPLVIIRDLLDQPESKTVNQLLADGVARLGDRNLAFADDIVHQAVARALPHVRSLETKLDYYKCLVEVNWPDVYTLLLTDESFSTFHQEDLFTLLEIDSQRAYPVLKTLADEEPESFEGLFMQLKRAHPEAAGLIMPGTMLETPFGQAEVVKITSIDGETLAEAVIDDENFILELVEGEGKDSIKVLTDWGRIRSGVAANALSSFIHPMKKSLNTSISNILVRMFASKAELIPSHSREKNLVF
jgi:hypothetical protein